MKQLQKSTYAKSMRSLGNYDLTGVCMISWMTNLTSTEGILIHMLPPLRQQQQQQLHPNPWAPLSLNPHWRRRLCRSWIQCNMIGRLRALCLHQAVKTTQMTLVETATGVSTGVPMHEVSSTSQPEVSGALYSPYTLEYLSEWSTTAIMELGGAVSCSNIQVLF